jgi:hypothetical protein
MADAWEVLVSKSGLGAGNDAWEHLDSLGTGSDAWEILVDASVLPEAPGNDAWIHLNAIGEAEPPSNLGRRSLARHGHGLGISRRRG